MMRFLKLFMGIYKLSDICLRRPNIWKISASRRAYQMISPTWSTYFSYHRYSPIWTSYQMLFIGSHLYCCLVGNCRSVRIPFSLERPWRPFPNNGAIVPKREWVIVGPHLKWYDPFHLPVRISYARMIEMKWTSESIAFLRLPITYKWCTSY